MSYAKWVADDAHLHGLSAHQESHGQESRVKQFGDFIVYGGYAPCKDIDLIELTTPKARLDHQFTDWVCIAWPLAEKKRPIQNHAQIDLCRQSSEFP